MHSARDWWCLSAAWLISDFEELRARIGGFGADVDMAGWELLGWAEPVGFVC